MIVRYNDVKLCHYKNMTFNKYDIFSMNTVKNE